MNSHINELDQPKAIAAAIILGFAGTGVAMGMPMLVGSLAESLNFNEQQLGWLASSDMGGLFIGSFVTALVVARANRRTLAYGGLLLVILSNFFSTQNQELLPLVLCRLGAGVGAGVGTTGTFQQRSHITGQCTRMLVSVANVGIRQNMALLLSQSLRDSLVLDFWLN